MALVEPLVAAITMALERMRGRDHTPNKNPEEKYRGQDQLYDNPIT